MVTLLCQLERYFTQVRDFSNFLCTLIKLCLFRAHLPSYALICHAHYYRTSLVTPTFFYAPLCRTYLSSHSPSFCAHLPSDILLHAHLPFYDILFSTTFTDYAFPRPAPCFVSRAFHPPVSLLSIPNFPYIPHPLLLVFTFPRPSHLWTFLYRPSTLSGVLFPRSTFLLRFIFPRPPPLRFPPFFRLSFLTTPTISSVSHPFSGFISFPRPPLLLCPALSRLSFLALPTTSSEFRLFSGFTSLLRSFQR